MSHFKISFKANDAPNIFVICGATGDLSQNKLLPSLWSLHKRNMLGSQYAIIAFSRRQWSDDEFRDFAKKAISARDSGATDADVRKFLLNIYYHQGMFNEEAAYEKLRGTFLRIDSLFGQCSNKLFYLAVPPDLYTDIITGLSKSGLMIPCGGDMGWARILIEKPFGRDSQSAKKLNSILSKHFNEEQIFVIDHYLAKETIQNILSFRFNNSLFEPLWNRDYIEKVEIKMHEKSVIGDRGSLYESLGALRDVGQNHLLQMLAVIAMNQPRDMTPDAIRKERAKIFAALFPVSKKSLTENVFKAQYNGYQSEKNVAPRSTTETFFNVKTTVNLPKWKGVTFVLESGKALPESRVEIKVFFRGFECHCTKQHGIHQNVLTFSIQPKEGISLRFWSKVPGFDHELECRDLSFKYAEASPISLPDAYEKVLYDCIRGDHTIFQSTEEIEAAWKFVSTIIDNWNEMALVQYNIGELPAVSYN